MNLIIRLVIISSMICKASTITVTLIPATGYSHTKSAVVLGQELFKRGHTVYVFQNGISLLNWEVKWKNINTHVVKRTVDEHYANSKISTHGSLFQDVVGGLYILKLYSEYCLDILNDQIAVSLLKKSDLIIGEALLNCVPYIATYADKPFIGLHHLVLAISNQVHRIPASPAFVAMFGTGEMCHMTLQTKVSQYFKRYILYPIFMLQVDKIFDPIRQRTGLSDSITTINRRIPLHIVPYDPLIECPQPIPSNMITPGIWTNEPAKPLPTKVSEFISDSENTILISFGSIFTLGHFGSFGSNLFLSMLENLKTKVILIGSSNQYKSSLPENVFITTVSPNDILAHPSIKLFVTHSGILSVREACYHGVPVVCVPIISEQVHNAILLTKRLKMGKMINHDPNNYDDWLKYIQEVINNNEYKLNAMRCSKLMKSKYSGDATKLAIDAVERFISWNYNASHLQPTELSVPWYEYYILDVILTVMVTLGVSYHIIRTVVRTLF